MPSQPYRLGSNCRNERYRCRTTVRQYLGKLIKTVQKLKSPEYPGFLVNMTIGKPRLSCLSVGKSEGMILR